MIKRSCLDCKHTTDEMKYCSAYEFPGLDDGLLPGLIVNCERWELKIHNISTSIKTNYRKTNAYRFGVDW